MIGRAKELEYVTRILYRRQKNSPILVGEMGVGKIAAVKDSIQLLARDGANYKFHGRMLYSVDLTQMLAGIHYRGDLEG